MASSVAIAGAAGTIRWVSTVVPTWAPCSVITEWKPAIRCTKLSRYSCRMPGRLTNVPRPCSRTRCPSATSPSTARRRVIRLTPYSAHSTGSGGSRVCSGNADARRRSASRTARYFGPASTPATPERYCTRRRLDVMTYGSAAHPPFGGEHVHIGVLTGGGDCPGLNAVLRAVVRTAEKEYGSTVVGFRNGWRGLLEDDAVRLEIPRVDGLLTRGGTLLGSARVAKHLLHEGLDRMRKVLDAHGVDVLLPIGGEGTLTAAAMLSREGVPVIGIPKTIDNDINGTDLTFGFDTAVSIATEMIDRLHTTAESHQRVLLVEVMGRHAGWIALNAGLAAGAHLTLVPEEPFDIEEVCRIVTERFDRGDSHVIGVVSEGATPKPGTMPLRDGGLDEYGHRRFTGVAQQLGEELERRTGKEVRTTVLGHVQRGGTPTSFDRVLATRFGLHATIAAHEGHTGQMVALHGTEIRLVPLADAVAQLKTVPASRLTETASFTG